MPDTGPSDTAVALIPARAGSTRVPAKNVRELAGHPLIAYTIAAAGEAGIFDAIVVSTEAEEIAEVARRYGAEVPALRPAEFATSTSPDVEWIAHMLGVLEQQGRAFEAFSILRPTSPFRKPQTIRRAVEQLQALRGRADSVRAVQPCREHPGKMWTIDGDLMSPLLPQPAGVPYHSRQYQDLPAVYVQNSSLEVAWTANIAAGKGIAGDSVAPLAVEFPESFSIDYPDEWERAERLLATGEASVVEPAVAA
jgi:CMP-N,N'-diacetyllegionaminic acid synthase